MLIEKRRLVVQAAGWSLIDLDLLTRLRPAPAAPLELVPDRDPHGTVCAQVEHADEPPAGFGFTGSAHVLARKDSP